MVQGDAKEALARRSARLWRVLVAGGVALAAACAGMRSEEKGAGSGSGSGAGVASDGTTRPDSRGGGASGW